VLVREYQHGARFLLEMNYGNRTRVGLGAWILLVVGLFGFAFAPLSAYGVAGWHVHNGGGASISWQGGVITATCSTMSVQVSGNCSAGADQWLTGTVGYQTITCKDPSGGTCNHFTVTGLSGIDRTNHAYWTGTAWASTNVVVWDDATQSWGPPATNGYSFTYVAWTNTSATKGAMFGWGLTDSNNVDTQNPDLRYVAPGGVVGFYATNWGSGGQFYWGDTRPEGQVPEGSNWGTWVGTGGPTGSGQTGTGTPTTGNFTNVTVTQTGGQGTNGLTQAVFQGGTLGIIQSVAGVEFTLAGVGSNIVGAINGLGTNAFGGTNADDSSIWVTNVYDQSISNQAAVAWSYMSNLISGGTNLMAAYSNGASIYSGNADVLAVNQVRSNAVYGLNTFWSGIAAMASPPGGLPDWGVITFPSPFGTWDIKESISLATLDEKVTGFRAWMKLLIMWGALVVLISAFVAELRLAVWQALAVPQTTNLGMQLLSTAGAVGGPIGYAAGTAAGHFVKAGTTIAIFVVILFFPSVIIVGIESLFTYLGMNSGWFVTSAASVITDTPTTVKQVLGQTSNWFPVVPLMAMALNYLLVKLSLDGIVSFACVYLKLAVPT